MEATQSAAPNKKENTSPSKTTLEECPLIPFHLRVALAGTGGQFADGYILGIVGIAVTIATPELHLNALWLGLLGAASLAGLFVGSLFSGPFLDRYGRRGLFRYDMAMFAVLSVAQFWVDNAMQLFVLRVLLGVVLGFDYVVSKAVVVEYSPRRWRGRLLSALGIVWAVGYLSAYVVGYLLKDSGPGVWRIMLMSSALPAALAFLCRLNIPESALWLDSKGRTDEALRIIKRYFGENVSFEGVRNSSRSRKTGGSRLWSREGKIKLFHACFSYTCIVIPYYALGTFGPIVFESLHIKDKFQAGLVYNAFLLAGTLVGAVLIDRVTRRTYMIGGFLICALLLGALSLSSLYSLTTLIVVLSGIFALALSGLDNLVYVYPAELFSTEVRATAVGIAVAVSRVGSFMATFLLPTIVQNYGGLAAILACVAVLVAGCIGGLWAPETRHVSMNE